MINKLERVIEYTNTEAKDVIADIIISYLLGLTTGGVGKFIGGDYKYVIPAFLPVTDLFAGRISPYLIPYTLGVATNYPNQVYETIKDLF
ncbi:hypothetical protein J4205_04150 [Candidatus Pacearchaeota archaeon]|nr:hypothetical protein [Candidatus Pacearchaeota archaeon]